MTENTRLRSIKKWFWKEHEDSIPNAAAFTRLYEETHLIVFRYVYGLSGGPLQEAEDLTAETYARAWKTRQRFNGDEQAALGWLLRIARNLAIDLSRRRKVRNIDESIPIELLADSNFVPEIDVITREQITILWGLLKTLSENVREMIVLRYILGWQIKQVAAHLGLSENNVSVTIRRALKSLQRDWPQLPEKDHE
ncbi:MAG: RNA polymerase sigma factor [Anaerolineae bacterium]|nr:RNA polymerase sigma factor [Anaerolineae bacterium]MCI0607645.1 RNA polymerase sigma factor [Anaerolineae bacterium]